MKKVAVVFADGMEEIEALTPVDLLRRAGATVDTVSVSGAFPTGSHNIAVKADKLVEQTDFGVYDCIVIPGGMPGATNISKNEKVISALSEFMEKGKTVCAICASPAVVLAGHGLINGRKATCYNAPVFVGALGESYTGSDVEVDGNLITANGPKSAMKFALAICEKLGILAGF